MKKQKKIFAIIGIIFLVALYASTLIFAFIDTTTSLIYLKCSIGATIFFPVVLYALTLFHKLGKPTDSDIDSDDK